MPVVNSLWVSDCSFPVVCSEGCPVVWRDCLVPCLLLPLFYSISHLQLIPKTSNWKNRSIRSWFPHASPTISSLAWASFLTALVNCLWSVQALQMCVTSFFHLPWKDHFPLWQLVLHSLYCFIQFPISASYIRKHAESSPFLKTKTEQNKNTLLYLLPWAALQQNP